MTPTPLRTTLTGEALRADRQALGLTQEALARALGISTQSVSDWECGRKPCALPGLLRLAMAHLAHLNTQPKAYRGHSE